MTEPVSERTLSVMAALPDGYDDQRKSMAQELLALRKQMREAKPVAWFQCCQGNYEQVAEKYKDEFDVIPLYTHPVPQEGYAQVPEERSYDMRAKGIIAFNQAKQSGDVDDALDAAWKAMLAASPKSEGYVLVPEERLQHWEKLCRKSQLNKAADEMLAARTKP